MAVDDVGGARLNGKRIVVTGASRGIGRAIAMACAAAGARVGVNYHRSRDRALAVCGEIGPAAAPLPVRRRRCRGGARAASMPSPSIAGGIDGLVNNAGINRPSLLVAASDADIAATIATNLVGPILCTRAVIPAMLEARRGVIVNVSSVAAGRPSRGQSRLRGDQGRDRVAHARRRGRVRAEGDPLPLRSALARWTRTCSRRPGRWRRRTCSRESALKRIASRRGDCGARRLSAERRGGLHHRVDPCRRRRLRGRMIGARRARTSSCRRAAACAVSRRSCRRAS